MIQKKYIVTGYEDLSIRLDDIKKEIDENDYCDGVICVYVANIPEPEIKDVLAALNANFPKLKITGMTSVAYTTFCNFKSGIWIDFTLMKSSKVTLFYREFDRDSKDLNADLLSYAKELRDTIINFKNVKAVEVYIAWLKISASGFIAEFSKGLEEVPFFGSIAGVNSAEFQNGYFSLNNGDSMVFADDRPGPGVSVTVYSGEELYVYEDYLFGWKPVGRYMDTKVGDISEHSNTVLEEIDGQKSTDIYYKYLGIKPNDNFVSNISEFPLVVERDGLYIGRTPSGCGPNGEVFLEGDVLENEKVRFSYGEKEEILNGTLDGANRMEGFGAERLSLVICANRFSFLQKDAHLEADYYSRHRKTMPCIVLGMGEIYRYRGRGGVLNSALVATGMREGLGDDISSPVIHSTELTEREGVVPLAERLSHFLKAMTEELVDAVKDAQTASEAKSAFLSNMSHEIRTPINAILGMDEIILREEKNDKTLEYAHNIKTAGNTLLSLVNEILDSSKIEAGKMDIIPVDYDFSSVLNDLLHMIKPKAEEKGLKLVFNIDNNIPSIMNGDEIRIKQIMTNILTNAIKYTEKGTITMNVGYEKLSDEKVAFSVSVKDTGIGIKEEDMNRLFGAFQRMDEKRNRTIEGTGLGLNITKKLLRLMGSELKVKSTYGEGSEFYFRLEQDVVKWAPIGDYMDAYKKALSKMEKYREKFTAPDAQILVVDDTPMNLTVFEGLLKQTEVKVDKALSGKECLEKSQNKKYDIIFLDHRMPEMDGIETLQKLKKQISNPNIDTPVVSLTANAVSGSREMYIEAGFDDYITKPIMTDKLEALMIRFLPKEKVKIREEQVIDEPEKVPEELVDIEGLDAALGMANSGGAELYLTAVRSFKDNYPENYEAIESFYKKDMIKDYTIKVHALKSSARIIGAVDLSMLAERLEKAGDENDRVTIEAETDKLLSMYKALAEKLNTEKEADNEDKPLMDENTLNEAILGIKELAASFDYDSVKYIMDEIDAHSVTEEKREALKELSAAVNRADWDKIKQILERI
ncbi:MAG: response regulator [Lachnospiraceae bacterium]|nr:response regulator [Lachnospiraceae bacterium]